MKIFEIKFTALWPVPCGLIIAAETEEQAREMSPVEVLEIKEIDISKPVIVFFESGNY